MRRVLIISEFIAPVQSVGSIRWTKIGKYLSIDHNCRVSILTNQKSFKGKKTSLSVGFDATLQPDLAYFDQIVEAPDSLSLKAFYLFRNLLLFVNNLARGKRKKYDGVKKRAHYPSDTPNHLTISSKFKWRVEQIKNYLTYKNVVRYLDEYPLEFDIVISSYSPGWPQYVARDLKVHNPGIAWVSDFRDPIFIGSHILVDEKRANVILEKSSCADCITALTSSFFALYPTLKEQKAALITNGFDPVLPQQIRSSTFNIVYTGTLYDNYPASSDLSPLLRAIKNLVDRKRVHSSDVRIMYAGRQSKIFLSQVSASGCSEMAVDLGYVDRQKALELQQGSSILALCTWSTEQEQGCTGKVYEYLSCKKPIAVINCGPVSNSLIELMLEQTKAGVCYEECNRTADIAKLSDFVLEKYEEWRETGFTTIASNQEAINQYSYRTIAGNVSDLLDLLLRDGKGKNGNSVCNR